MRFSPPPVGSELDRWNERWTLRELLSPCRGPLLRSGPLQDRLDRRARLCHGFVEAKQGLRGVSSLPKQNLEMASGIGNRERADRSR